MTDSQLYSLPHEVSETKNWTKKQLKQKTDEHEKCVVARPDI